MTLTILKSTTSEGRVLLPETQRRSTREVMSGCSVVEDQDDDTGIDQAGPPGVCELPVAPPDYRILLMVDDDGTPLVELRVHKRAEDRDLVPELRAWFDRVRQKPPIQLLDSIPEGSATKTGCYSEGPQ